MFSFFSLMVENPVNYVIVKLVVSLLQISKMAINHPGEKAVLGKLFISVKVLTSVSKKHYHCASHFDRFLQ